MVKFNKLLVAVAFSPYSEGIVSYAAQLASRLDAEMVLASIINERDVSAIRSVADMGYEVDGAHYVRDVKKERKEQLAQMITAGGLDPQRVSVVIRVGNPVDELLKIIVSQGVDIVLMGAKGRTDWEHAFIGSVAEKLFRRSPVAVLSYRDEKLAGRLLKRIPA